MYETGVKRDKPFRVNLFQSTTVAVHPRAVSDLEQTEKQQFIVNRVTV